MSSTTYELPDGKIVDIADEKFNLSEKFFNTVCKRVLFFQIKEFPGFQGYHQMIMDAISRGDLDIRKEMYSNILVIGGNTLLPGFIERMQKQLYNYTSQSAKIKLITHPSNSERKFSTWIGGSILSSLGTNIFINLNLLQGLSIKCGFQNKNLKNMDQ